MSTEKWEKHCFFCGSETEGEHCNKCQCAVKVHGYEGWAAIVIARVENGEPIHREYTEDGIQGELFRKAGEV